MPTGKKKSARQEKIKVLIVDDHPLCRRGLATLIADQPDLEVCGEAANAVEALRHVSLSAPDLAIVDISLKEGHGIELVKQIKIRDQRVKMLVYSMHDEALFAGRALRRCHGFCQQTGEAAT